MLTTLTWFLFVCQIIKKYKKKTQIMVNSLLGRGNSYRQIVKQKMSFWGYFNCLAKKVKWDRHQLMNSNYQFQIWSHHKSLLFLFFCLATQWKQQSNPSRSGQIFFYNWSKRIIVIFILMCYFILSWIQEENTTNPKSREYHASILFIITCLMALIFYSSLPFA